MRLEAGGRHGEGLELGRALHQVDHGVQLVVADAGVGQVLVHPVTTVGPEEEEEEGEELDVRVRRASSGEGEEEEEGLPGGDLDQARLLLVLQPHDLGVRGAMLDAEGIWRRRWRRGGGGVSE